jgi:hypothetical protein
MSMFGQSGAGMMFGGMVIWLVWLALTIFAFVAFLRGMNALTQIARRMENIERLLEGRRPSP